MAKVAGYALSFSLRSSRFKNCSILAGFSIIELNSLRPQRFPTMKSIVVKSCLETIPSESKSRIAVQGSGDVVGAVGGVVGAFTRSDDGDLGVVVGITCDMIERFFQVEGVSPSPLSFSPLV